MKETTNSGYGSALFSLKKATREELLGTVSELTHINYEELKRQYIRINHPDYYQLDGGLETIDVIDSLGLGEGFALGNAIKYIFRAGKKSGNTTQEDIKKAIWYLEHYIQKLKEVEAKHDQARTQNE